MGQVKDEKHSLRQVLGRIFIFFIFFNECGAAAEPGYVTVNHMLT